MRTLKRYDVTGYITGRCVINNMLLKCDKTGTPRSCYLAACRQHCGGDCQFAGTVTHLPMHSRWCPVSQPFSQPGRRSCPLGAAAQHSRAAARMHHGGTWGMPHASQHSQIRSRICGCALWAVSYRRSAGCDNWIQVKRKQGKHIQTISVCWLPLCFARQARYLYQHICVTEITAPLC